MRSDREPVFVDKMVVGYIEDGAFCQRVTDKHIFRQYNAKGIDANLFRRLRGSCHTWRLIFKKTGQVLSIPLEKIEAVGWETDTGAGKQLLVKLTDFNEDRPVIQKALF
ncbi:hypothetical protein ES703_31181 [subsurface metagenome]